MQPSEKFSFEFFLNELREIIHEEISINQRPSNKVIMYEVDFCEFLKISKRHAANLRAKRNITYSKSGGKIYSRLSNELEFIEKNEIKCVDRTNNIFNNKRRK